MNPVSASATASTIASSARAALAAGDGEQALRLARAVADMPGADAAALGNAGTVLAACARHGAALDAFARAAALAPGDARHLFNHAMALRAAGQLDAAQHGCDAVIARAPHHGEAWLMRSGLRRQTAAHNHIADLEAMLTRPGPDWRTRAQWLFALAKEREDLGDHAASFAALAQGAALRRGHMQYDPARDLAMIAALIEGFPAPAPAPATGADDLAAQAGVPIFILGLPRTGTTLLDRMVSSHPQVESLGEPPAFTEAMVALLRQSPPTAPGAAAMVAAARALDPRALAAGYHARVAPLRQRQGGAFVDKLPMNTLNLGLIARALPQARLVLVSRDLRDTGYAMFKTWFEAAYPFSYDLRELGAYIAAHQRLVAHWQAVLGPRLLTVAYEDLVADPEQQMRAVLAHCGLDWHAACCAPQDNAAPATTASAAQVREGIHTRSVGQWRHHAAALAPLFAQLPLSGATPGVSSRPGPIVSEDFHANR